MKFLKARYLLILALVIGAIVFICYQTGVFKTPKQTHASEHTFNPQFAAYISSFTSGYISTKSSIKIRFSNALVGSNPLNTPLQEVFFDFEPKLEGEVVFKDAQTLEFIPKEDLKPGQRYSARFHLNKLIEVKQELKDFDFQFQVIKQSLQLITNDLKCYSCNDFQFYSLSGELASADFADQTLIEKTVSANLNKKSLRINWIHDESGTSHKFSIDSLERSSVNDGKLLLNCDGKFINCDYKTSQEIIVPAKNKFELLNVKVVQDRDPFVLINFSNPLNQMQSLEGLLNINGLPELKYIINQNQVLLYPANAGTNAYKLNIDAGIKDAIGQALNKNSEHSIIFEQARPEVRFCGNGNILPSTNGLKLAFETVNLKAVDVRVVKIYENNILQFLQNNSLNGSNELAQVGKKIAQKRINLGINNVAELSTWKKFSLDLSSLIKAEPGAIYRVYLSMKKSYASYPCLGNSTNEDFEMQELKENNEEEEINYFGYYDLENNYNDYDYNNGEEYRWEDRDDPCKAYYYLKSQRTVAKNILASDLALTAKKGDDGSLFIAAADLISAKPEDNVVIDIYDYQKQLLATTKTNFEGQVFLNAPQSAAFIVAKKGKQSAYLRIEDVASLPLSMFDVSGDAVKKGIKGFIYAERGVWRPGDSLFLNFILEDKLGKIPEGHPVVLDLVNPQGQLYKRLLSTKGLNGFYSFITATDKNAPTGLWNAEIKIGAIKFNKSIRIETIVPNRLKIEVNVGDNLLLSANKLNTIQLHSHWLTGAKASGLAANVNVTLSRSKTEFAKLKQYIFDDATAVFEAQQMNVLAGNLDEEGNLSKQLVLNLQKNAPGFLKANFYTSVFEPGGAFSVDRFILDYSPYNVYVGIKVPEGEKNSGILYTGQDHVFNIATVNEKGLPVSQAHLKMELYKLEWRWWWDQYENELSNFVADEYHQPVMTENFSSKNGFGQIKLNITENNWGRYLLRVCDLDGGHCSSTIVYFDWSNWMSRDGGSDNKIVSNLLSFSADKESYQNGEEVKLKIPTPQNGRALLTIENGSRVIEAHWLETKKGSTDYRFKVTPQMAPNIYVHVSLIQPHSRTNDLPIRMYGVLPIKIEDPNTKLHPMIQMPKTLVPEQEVTMVVSEQNNKEMAFTLALVDEGLLDITRFKTPDPHSSFYAKEALGVKTWDLYDDVIGAYGIDLERVLSIGGDKGELSKDGSKANRFKPMVKFFGPYNLKKGEKKTIRFKMPMYVGALRSMLIAGNKGAYGIDEKSIPVKAPLMILGTLPRVLSVTEEVKLPVSIFAGDKSIGPVTVNVEVNGLLQKPAINSKTIQLNKNQEKLLVFDLKVGQHTGVANVKINASGNGYKARYDMQIEVRNPNPIQTSSKDVWVEASKSIKTSLSATGLPGTNAGVVELSSIPPINLEERLQYLISYPHGCIEQTTSQTFAQLYLDEILELNTKQKVDIEKNIKIGINELVKFQLPSGGMSYWQGTNEVDDWGTSYACHFLVCAEKKGYAIPSVVKKQWTNYQQQAAQKFVLNRNKQFPNDMNQAYRLYVLAMAGQPVLGAMNRLRENNNISTQSKWLLAGAYALSGQPEEAQKIIANLSGQINSNFSNFNTYGSEQRDMAIVLEGLCLLNKKQQAFDQLKKVSAFLSSKSWLSTQTTAYGLVAVSTFVKKYGGSSAMQTICKIDGKIVDKKGKASIQQIPLDFKNKSTIDVDVQNNGKGLLYLHLVSRGIPPIGEEMAENKNLNIEVAYKNLNGETVDVDALQQGENFILSVKVTNIGYGSQLKNLALTTFIPSGWEIHNARLNENESAMKNSTYVYQDIRDDKVLTYFDLNNNESKTFNLMLNASYEGRFYLPAIQAEAMYDNTVYARTAGRWIRVLKQNSKVVAGK
jgi:alpha-2-macroglobulin